MSVQLLSGRVAFTRLKAMHQYDSQSSVVSFCLHSLLDVVEQGISKCVVLNGLKQPFPQRTHRFTLYHTGCIIPRGEPSSITV